MFDLHDARWSSAPYSSSPPSSPTAYNDSSPASSPRPDYDDSVVETSRASPPVHPFAASASSWIPPEYEKGGKKNRQVSPSSPSRARSKKPRLVGPESSLETVVAPPSRVSVPPTDKEKEAATWDAAITQMFNSVNGTLTLENLNLTSFPEKFIEDLSFYVAPEKEPECSNAVSQMSTFTTSLRREYGRAFTAPAVFSRVPDSAIGTSRQNIQLYLAGNQISRLPIPLLCLKKLTVLSMRNNKLKAIPPEICQLPNLHTLNVSGNLLTYLPAEMQDMRLKILNVFPNRFTEPLLPRSTSSRRLFQTRVALSSTSRTPGRLPSLVELCLRSLFSRDSADAADYTNRRIEKYYELPLCEAGVALSGSGKKEFRQLIPPNIRAILHAIHPGSVDADEVKDDPHDDPPSLGVCPSPSHLRHPLVFVTPAEERYTWETVVAGVEVGGTVPLKWRGCLYGCLDFLGTDTKTELPSQVVMQGGMDVNEENSEQEQQAVTRLQFGSNELGGDDFGDDG
ncbi:hypothetical protein C8R45DRAFT_143652 [Mycena sanguinolenta]|nr:hypothetical protein C8R45DRAFT_143652 [Mycena sanguinolenta]